MPRTGTMISASGGKGGEGAAPRLSSETVAAASAIRGLRLLQRNEQATVGRRSMNGAVAAGRKTNAPFESALRKLETVDDRGPHLRRIGPMSGNEQFALIDERLDLAEVDPGQSDEHQHRALGLENVDRRLPGDRRRASRTAGKIADAFAPRAPASRTLPTTSNSSENLSPSPHPPGSAGFKSQNVNHSIAQFPPEFIRALGAPSSPPVSWALQLRILNQAGADSKRSGSLIRRTAGRRRVFVPWIR